MTTLQQRIDQDGITFEATYRGRDNEAGWTHDAWIVDLEMDGRRLSIPFKMGTGHEGSEPSVSDVLGSLLSDAAGYYNANGFEDWASEYGYDTDSRRAEATYNAVMEQTTQLSDFLGDKLNAYLWDTDQD